MRILLSELLWKPRARRGAENVSGPTKTRMWLYVLRLGLLKKALFVATGCSVLLVYGTFTQKLEERPTLAMEAFANTHWHSIKEIANFDVAGCDELVSVNASEDVVGRARKWTYAMRKELETMTFPKVEQRCDFLKKHYGFNLAALSDEEKSFPIAYGILVHKSADQVFYMMSAIYHPQNAYCIAVDKGSKDDFKKAMELLQTCFPNIYIINAQKISYCGHSVLSAVTSCLYYLARSDHKWKYYQYLSGVDLPLKTNREMVRIFKRLNGSFNAEVKEFQLGRLKTKKAEKVPGDMKMFKSSLSATFSRESANFLARSRTAAELHRFLQGTYCPDESFWMTMAGNPQAADMPGGLNATRFLSIMKRYVPLTRTTDEVEDVTVMPYYISRFQSWSGNMWKPCKGKYVSTSCVFGVGDVASLLRRPQLVAHKFYVDFEPAAFFCVFKKVRDRALRPIDDFSDAPYGDLPGPRITRGDSVEDWFNKSYARFHA